MWRFSDEGRLAWMYKEKVDNEEYLLGRRIDNSSLNEPEPATQGKLHYLALFVTCVWNLFEIFHLNRKTTQLEQHLLRTHPISVPYLSTYLSPRVGMSRNRTHGVRVCLR